MRLSFLLLSFALFAQHPNPNYWQQQADYQMDVDVDVNTFLYEGTQELHYTNQSPDTLNVVYYHLYFNAFQPGSQMDIRSRTIEDPDSRVGDRISKLEPHEIGFLRVQSLKQDGVNLDFKEEETILVVPLDTALLPGESTTLSMVFRGQVPKQIRRSGRNNKEGVALSMTQWYPKLVEYDQDGWHPNPYIGREFHGVWGTFDVKLTLDKDYIVGGTGYLQNAEEIGYGYHTVDVDHSQKENLTWHFYAPNVHDFAWGADPDYVHDTLEGPDGVTLHFLYLDEPELKENWKRLQDDTAKMMSFFNASIGPYPWDQYSVIQGGDGGMEYAMCTLITGQREYTSLFGVTAHELAHSWFHHLFATNEAKYAWMDEGFTSFFDALAEATVLGKENPFGDFYSAYFELVASGKEEPMTTHADRFKTNYAYRTASYRKGALFLIQLGYIVGFDNLNKIIKNYYDQFKFTHPTPEDFTRLAEQTSGIQLEWYLNDWVRTTNTIDYGIEKVEESPTAGTTVTLVRKENMPMPIELLVVYNDGQQEFYYIPLYMMFGEKKFSSSFFDDITVLKDWSWASPRYTIELSKPIQKIKEIIIDPSRLMADINSDNNYFVYEVEQTEK